MATLADSMVSSVSRPVALRMRADLSARRQRYHGRAYWVVKEPVGLNYFRFHEEEYEILCMLDGSSSMTDIKDRFEDLFPPQKVTFQDLQQFVGTLHRSGLVTSSASGQGVQLKSRGDQKKRRELLGKLSNVFAVRWRGIDPEKILNAIYPWTGWFFSPLMLVVLLMFGLSALTLVAVQFGEFQSRLPTFHQFFGPSNWIYLGITMAGVKVCHEFGHGLTCKRFGGECHEMGFMLLVFTPALYCNVSDSWMLPNKWHRVFIGAAGMYVEMFFASVATFLWWFSTPGVLINQLSLSVMFICSVSTLLFNGNPLLRFDGYYILMDLIEIPNLRQKSTEITRRFLTALCLGIDQPESPFLPQQKRFFFGLYTAASVVYRWVIVFSIVMFLNKALEPYGLKVLGQIVAFAGFIGLIVQPFYKLAKFFYVPGRMHKVKKHRLALTCLAAVAVVVFVFAVPLPYHIDCTLTVVPVDAKRIFVKVPGRLEVMLVKSGSRIVKDQEIAKFENIDLQLAVTQLEGQLEQAETQLRSLRRQRANDRAVGSQIAPLEELKTTLQKQLKEKEGQLKNLVVTSPVEGVVIPAEPRRAPSTQDGRLPSWTGTLLEERNQGAHVTPSEMICQVGDPDRLQAELVIDQNDIELINKEQRVEIILDALPGLDFETTIDEIASSDLKVSPASLASQLGGDLNTAQDSSGVLRPISTSYQAKTEQLELPSSAGSSSSLQIGWRGSAKIHVQDTTLGSRLKRFLVRTFHFEL